MRSDTDKPITMGELMIYAKFGSHPDIRAMATELAELRARTPARMSDSEREPAPKAEVPKAEGLLHPDDPLAYLVLFGDGERAALHFYADDARKNAEYVGYGASVVPLVAAPTAPPSPLTPEPLTVAQALMLPEVRSGAKWIEATRPLVGGGTESSVFFIRQGDIINKFTNRWTALTLKDFDHPARLIPPDGAATDATYCAQCYFNGYGELWLVGGRCPNPKCALLRYEPVSTHWLDCSDCRARSKSGATPPRCELHVRTEGVDPQPEKDHKERQP